MIRLWSPAAQRALETHLLHHDRDDATRRAKPTDRAFLSDMARLACTLEGRPIPPIGDQELREMLPGNADVALIGFDETGQPVGAAWWHLHAPPLLTDEHGRPLPEIVIAVVEHARGHGLGTRLIEALAREATGRFSALSLNVHLLNPAVRLYVRTEFRVAGAGRGWYGVAMRRVLPALQGD